MQSQYPMSESDGHGSVFTATFPLGKDHLPAARINEFAAMTKKQSYAHGLVEEVCSPFYGSQLNFNTGHRPRVGG